MAFLTYTSDLIPLGSSVNASAETIRGLFETNGWQTQRKCLAYGSLLGDFTYAINAFDGNEWSTYNNTGVPACYGGALPRYVGARINTADHVTEYTIYGDSNPNNNPKDWTLDYSDDGSSWTTADTQSTVSSWGVCEAKTYTVGGTPGNHAYWRLRVTASVGACTYSTGSCAFAQLRMKLSSGHYIATVCSFVTIPPSSETIGDSYSKDALNVTIADTYIDFHPIVQSLTTTPAALCVKSSVAGAVAYGITLGGVSITGSVGGSSATAGDNLRSLYEAITGSVISPWVDWNWLWNPPSPQNADDASYHINATKKVASTTSPTLSNNGNCTSGIIGYSSNHEFTSVPTTNYANGIIARVTTDLTNGYYYYAQFCSRAVAFATKTNTAVYGPIHASWGDHTKALAAMPTTFEPRYIGPIELLVGTDDVSGSASSTGYTSRAWKLSSCGQQIWVIPNYDQNNNVNGYECHLFSGAGFRGQFIDVTHGMNTGGTAYMTRGTLALRASSTFGIGETSTVDNDFQIHKAGSYAPTEFPSGDNGYWSYPSKLCSVFTPMVDVQDWYKFIGTASQEALILAADTVSYKTLSTAISITGAVTTIVLNNVTGLASAGYVVIEGELFVYTGTSGGTTLTGVTRAQYGTPQQGHAVSTKVYQGMWYTLINGGALLAGPTMPT